ncbi:MAG: UDP-N-acetylmuramoyl-tripeptide--D-alanyl-D-alanine ligase [Acidobacteriota bacterium]
MLGLSIREAAVAMGARPVGRSDDDPLLARPFPSVSIDTRTLRTGECYFAIAGERHDGHDFLTQAVEAGAAVLIVGRTVPEALGRRLPVLLVEDTTRALQDLGRRVRKIWGGKLVAITGSMGKTTTREFTVRLLSKRLQVLQPYGNFNNHIGLPLSLTRLASTHNAAVVELGMNHAGEIDLLGDICRPDIAVITNIAPVHLEFFESIDAIAQAKGEILHSLPEDGSFVFNSDDERARKLAETFQGQTVSFGFGPEADYRISEWAIRDLSGMSFAMSGPGLLVTGRLGVVGKHFLYDAAAAVAVAGLFDLRPDEIHQGLSRLLALQGRGRLLCLDSVRLWDDSYNSNPQALESVLETLSRVETSSRKVLVLGDMLELGPTAPELHRRVGMRAAEVAALLVTVGSLAEHLRAGAIEAGLPMAATRHFASAEEAAEALPGLLHDGDLVLVKASRGVHLDRIVEALAGGKP